jgi:uncharacterized protein (DUF1778 family)
MKKTERLFIRVAPNVKERIKRNAQAEELSITNYLLKYLPDNPQGSPITHEQLIQSTFTENQFYNNLMANKKLNNKAKQIISKELKNYV